MQTHSQPYAHTHTHTQPYAHVLSALCTHTLSPMMSYKFFQLHVILPPSILCHTPALSTFITSIPSVLSYVPSALSAPGLSKFLSPLQYIPLTTPPLAQYRVYLHHWQTALQCPCHLRWKWTWCSEHLTIVFSLTNSCVCVAARVFKIITHEFWFSK